jgi:hypothetical protein
LARSNRSISDHGLPVFRSGRSSISGWLISRLTSPPPAAPQLLIKEDRFGARPQRRVSHRGCE